MSKDYYKDSPEGYNRCVLNAHIYKLQGLYNRYLKAKRPSSRIRILTLIHRQTDHIDYSVNAVLIDVGKEHQLMRPKSARQTKEFIPS